MGEDALDRAGDENDPDWIAAHPPEEVPEPSQYFQQGEHDGRWTEYDERGVPTRTIKKKKLTRKEKDALETEYLEAKKSHTQYLEDVETWERRKGEAESALEHTDRLRWAFRQIDKSGAPIPIDELEEVFRLMNWTLKKKELSVMKKLAAELSEDGASAVGLRALRTCVDRMAVRLFEERLSQIGSLAPERLYSPRSWRMKLGDHGESGKDKKSKKSGDSKKPKKDKDDRGDKPKKSRPSVGSSSSVQASQLESPRRSAHGDEGDDSKKEKKEKKKKHK